MDDTEDIATLDGRVATFDRPHYFSKRRASASTKKKAQSSVTWPHENLDPKDLARAGFYFKPSIENQDSVTCFLCGKALDGWDAEDDPAVEHLSHVPDCGWAINLAIERRSQDEDRAEEDPLGERMMESRRSTFKDAWPHEGKKGWKCKLEKMVASGWCYAPLPDADDCVHCFYCGVSLDGWERKDDPWEEHRRRAPECHFFTLVEESAKIGKPKSKSGRGRQSRASKASRASTQSIQANSDLDAPPLELDETIAEDDDTVLTAASTTSKTDKSRKKGAKGKVVPKRTRVAQNKRSSNADDSTLPIVDGTEAAAPVSRSTKNRQISVSADALSKDVDMSEIVPKKPRATRGRKAPAVDDSVVEDPEKSTKVESTITSSPALPNPPKKRTKKQAPVETAEEQINVSDPAEIEAAPPVRTTRKASNVKGPKVKQQLVPTPAEAEIDAVPASSETTRATRGKKRTSDGLEKFDSSIISTNPEPVKKPRGRAATLKKGPATTEKSKQSAEQEQEHEASSVVYHEARTIVDPDLPKEQGFPQALAEDTMMASTIHENQLKDQVQGVEEAESTQVPPTPPLDPSRLSQSVSPQSSDAENRPPSSRPSFVNAIPGDAMIQMPLKTRTPVASPSKRIIPGGLHSSAPWTPVDLEHIFLPSPSSRRIQGMEENENLTVESITQRLTSPEKKMSVEQWIMWNAQKAEDRLKGECERLIGAFEGEGVRALRALEGIDCVE